MITPIDIFCLAITVVLIVVESQRGVWVALVDLSGGVGIVYLAGYATLPLAPWISPASSAYFLVLVLGIVLVGAVSAYVSTRTKEHVRNWECAAGAFVGLGSAIALSYGVFRFITMKYGAGASFVADSLLAYGFAADGVLHEWSDFMHLLMGR